MEYEIDDRLPVNQYGSLRNVQLSASGELWPALLEKAMAAMFGGYGELEGNLPYVAFKALTGATGDRLLRLSKTEENRWVCRSPKLAGMGRKRQMHILNQATWPNDNTPGDCPKSDDEMLDVLMWLDKGECLMCVASKHEAGNGVITSKGVEAGHAYSLLQIATNLGPKKDLLQLRNPHGHGSAEWTGAWSDGHPIWATHPAIKAKLKPDKADDGCFWIQREDFVHEFEGISICLSDGCAKMRGTGQRSQ